MHKVIRYKCDFCKKTYENKSSAVRHENKCFFNPKTKSCVTCTHFVVQNSEEDRRCLKQIDINKLKTQCSKYQQYDLFKIIANTKELSESTQQHLLDITIVNGLEQVRK